MLTSLPELAPRQQRMLRALVHEYVRTAQPVASEALVRRYRLGVSSATVRNELARLEELGLLSHPHTSAGRVPTGHGYRYFIDLLMEQPVLGPDEQTTVRHQFHQVHFDTGERLRLAASTLARLSYAAALVTEPQAARARVRHVEIVPIQARRVLLVVVLEGGVVRQQLLELPEGRGADALRTLSARLTSVLSTKDAAGVRALGPADGVERTAVDGVARSLDEQDHALAIGVYYDGFVNLLRQPEFASSAVLREAFTVLEDRTRLTRMLPPLGTGEVRVVIGEENALEPLRQFSLVFGRYGADSVGYMGIVGPTRMDYARSIGAVRYVATLMSELMRAVGA